MSFRKFNHVDNALESQRTLDQLRKIAYELKDGETLEKICTQLLNDIQSSYTNEGIKILNSLAGHRTNESDLASLYIHQSKIHLAMLETMQSSIEDKRKYMTENVEAVFWKAFDKRKETLQYVKHNNPADLKKTNQRLVKDFSFLFTLHCKRFLLGIKTKRHDLQPYEYVINQASKLFKGGSQFQLDKLKNILNERKIEMQKTGAIPLDYAFFKGLAPPSVLVPDNLIEDIFKNFQTTSRLKR